MRAVAARIYKTLFTDTLHRRLVGGALWNLLRTVFVQASSFVSVIIFARVLGPEGFGKLNMVRAAVLVLVAVAGSGLGAAATKYVAEYRLADPLRAGKSVGMLYLIASAVGILVAITCVIFSESLAGLVVGSKNLSLELVIGGLSVFFLAIGSVQIGAIAGLEQFRCVAFLVLIEATLNLIFASSGAILWGVPGVLAGVTLAVVVMSPIKHKILRRELKKYGIEIVYQEAWKVGGTWKFILPATLVSMTAQPVEWFLKLRLAGVVNGYEELAIFAVASSLALIVQILPSQLATSARSILPNLYASKDFVMIRKLLITNSIYSGGMGVMVAIPLALFATFLLGLYGPNFNKGVEALYLLLFSYSTVVIGMTFTELLTACGYMWLQYLHRIVWAVVSVVSGIYLFSPTAVGLASAYVLGNFIYSVIQAFTVVWLLNKMKNEFVESFQIKDDCVSCGVNEIN